MEDDGRLGDKMETKWKDIDDVRPEAGQIILGARIEVDGLKFHVYEVSFDNQYKMQVFLENGVSQPQPEFWSEIAGPEYSFDDYWEQYGTSANSWRRRSPGERQRARSDRAPQPRPPEVVSAGEPTASEDAEEEAKPVAKEPRKKGKAE